MAGTIKFFDEMQNASNVSGQDKMMIGKAESGETQVITFDQAKQYLDITSNEIAPIVGGDSEANATPVPAGPAGQTRRADVAPGWIDFGSGPIEAAATNRWMAYWDGSSWSLVDMGELPQQEGVDTINPEGDALPKEKAVAKYVDPLSAMINGGDIVFGDTDFTSYTTNNSQEYLFLHRAFPVNVKGDVVESNAVFHRAGAYNVYIARPVPGQSQRFTMLGKSAKTATVGNNAITLDIDTLPGDLLAIGQVAGGALIKTKVGTNGLWLNITTSNADVDNGTEVAFSGSNRIMALNFKVSVGGIQGEVEDVNNRVDLVQTEMTSSMKEPDLTIEKSKNMFDPSKIVSGKYVSNTGSVASGDGWELICIDVSTLEDGEDITFNGINPSMPSYFGFYSTSDGSAIDLGNLITGSNGTFNSNPVTVHKLSGAIGFAITIKRPANTSSVYASAVINIGNTPIPYEPFTGDIITKYKSLSFAGASGGGGEAYDQSLNTTDDVEFNSVTTNDLETSVLIANLPEWDEMSSASLLEDQAYKFSDGNGNFFIKSKGGV